MFLCISPCNFSSVNKQSVICLLSIRFIIFNMNKRPVAIERLQTICLLCVNEKLAILFLFLLFNFYIFIYNEGKQHEMLKKLIFY